MVDALYLGYVSATARNRGSSTCIKVVPGCLFICLFIGVFCDARSICATFLLHFHRQNYTKHYLIFAYIYIYMYFRR